MILIKEKMNNLWNTLKRQKSVNISECDASYKVQYLGNVLTAFMKGEGCVDRPVDILWNNFLANPNSPLQMDLTICGSGLKVETAEQGLTEYRSHRISYCTCLPKYSKLFIWVYRHEGKKMKVELRCHAVLCKSEEKAKLILQQLQAKLSSALMEYTREKTRRQNSRLMIQKSNSPLYSSTLPTSTTTSAKPTRTKFLTTGDNFKLPSEHSNKAPKLTSITEDDEPVPEEEEGEEVMVLGRVRAGNQKENLSESVCLNPEINMSLASVTSIVDKPDADDNTSNESGFSDDLDNDTGKL